MKKNIVEESTENDVEYNDENDENYGLIKPTKASKLQGFCNRNRNFNIPLRKFNSAYVVYTFSQLL